MLQFIRTVFFWDFGVLTCLYFTGVTLNGCSQSPYLLAVCSPLIIISAMNAVLLVLTSAAVKPSRSAMFILGTLSGISIVVAAVLFAVLSPLSLLAFMASIFLLLASGFSVFASLATAHLDHAAEAFWGIGLSLFCILCLSIATGPLLTALAMNRRLKKMLPPAEKRAAWLPMLTCMTVVLAFVMASIFPVLLTHECQAAVANETMLPQGLLLLRALADDNAMLQACYGESTHVPWFFDLPLRMFNQARLSRTTISEQQAREIYYRVTGHPFNTVPRTKLSFLGKGMPFFGEDDYNFYDDYYMYLDRNDHDFTADTVGGVVRGLNLAKSQINGWADADELVAHLNWKMDFRIEEGAGKEIRGQILLPPHAVVTGCNLWINGVKRPCVIATRESSREAYTASASAGEKPLLTSTAGAGRILFQSSTGFWGKGAILDLEITAPLVLMQPDKAALPLPYFTERNFSVSALHEISLQSQTTILQPSYLTASHQTSSRTNPVPTEQSAVGTINNAALSEGKGALFFARNPAVVEVGALEPLSKEMVDQKIVFEKMSPQTPSVIVVDGSASMLEATHSICDSLRHLHLNDASIIWASDQPIVIASHASTESPTWSQALDELQDSSCLGGQNNAQALSLALSKFGETSDSNIVWLHAGQPVKFSGDTLLAKVNAAKHKIRLYEYQVCPGPNEVIKSLDQTAKLIQVPRLISISEDLNSLFDRLSGRVATFNIEQSLVPFVAPSTPQAKHANEIAQLYVSDLVFMNVSKQSERTKYGRMAEALQLVTPITSALVLDKDKSYEKYGVVKHSNSGSVHSSSSVAAKISGSPLGNFIPVKPEPPMSWIMACAMSAMALFFALLKQRRTRTN